MSVDRLTDRATGIAIRFVRQVHAAALTEPTINDAERRWADIAHRAGVNMPHDRILQFFVYDHLPPKLQEASKPFCELAEHLVATYPMNPERTVALRKLLEAKDAAVRMILDTAAADS